jgi:RNA polymerase sigma factor (sigma-70 family)
MTADRDPMSDAAIRQRMLNGDRSALGELYDEYAGIALALAVRVVRDRAVAEDVVHDAYVAAWDKIDGYDAARGSLRTWLLAIVRNRALDRLRQTRPTDDLAVVDERFDRDLAVTNPTWELTVAALDRAALQSALATLPGDQRQAIELAYFDGRTYRQVAADLGIPEGTAASRLRLAMVRLRTAMTTEPTAARSDVGVGPTGESES